jgi:pantetheine-phosphate adenylyltransferase
MRVGIYPGTFDPITRGHMDIIHRALEVVDKLVIAVAADSGKTPIFTLDERQELAKETVCFLEKSASIRVEVKQFQGLLVNFARETGATVIIRGLRAVADYEYEFQMACMNSKLAPDIQTVFLPASESTQFIASRLVKQVAQLGGDISAFVTPNVEKRLKEKVLSS